VTGSARQASPGPDRGSVWRRLGAPTDQVGSVNDPRLHEEYGVQWNEKWIYRGEDGVSVERVVLWNRYDLAGVYRIGADGRAEPETLDA
jgi:hypothetical protein